MSDWTLPLLSSTYSDFLTLLKGRDNDALSLGGLGLTNPPTSAMKFERASNRFEEWNGSAWVPKPIGVLGGGTGASDASTARTNLGLGTIATQNSNSIFITGGTITGLGGFGVNGNATIGGTLGVTGIVTLSSNLNVTGISDFTNYIVLRNLMYTASGGINMIDAAGKIPAIDSTRFSSLSGANLTALNANQLATGTVPIGRLGSSGTPSASTFLRGDNTWGQPAMVRQVVKVKGNIPTSGTGIYNYTISPALIDYTKAVVDFCSLGNVTEMTSNTNLSVGPISVNNITPFIAYIVEYNY